MRKTFAALAAAALLAAPAFAQGEGPMERVGKTIDEGVENARGFLSDAAITTRVKKRLIRDDYVSGFDIDVTTIDGRVTLEGDTPSEEVAQRAVEIARATEGVKSVDNRLWIVTRTPSKAQ
ncbi:MAG: BON domain-containing protein [Candidatus Nitrospinota bacterium M3_3B_026]